MAVDMFLKFADSANIKGESKDKTYGKSIDVLAWSWGMSQSGTFHTGGGGGAGKVNMQDISVTKWVDSASYALMDACATGEHIDDATLVVRKAGGKAGQTLEYIKIKMEKIMVTAVSTGGSGGEDRLTENVSLNFAKVTFSYTEQTDKGAGEAAKDFKWNIEENAKF
ncbi:Hcp family type VI secretion system effector [Plasticicumulans acidivorans]|uniref:Type VI secretion system secreted protein Hcp n=1 Tax=Plasticicumulans acidivorans TaxID=886464 RepID=A0A317MZ08_9GAMM|nr:type VI secretion system tube protein Hcp [Plasticicumulans acidivorans]PWV64784.1 type VI secretion system secreted protein Hcp [Plasticicumulans acidivorans]